MTLRQSLLCASIAFMAISFPVFANQIHGVIQIVKGEVHIVSIREGQTVRAKVGLKIYPKDTVITGKDSRIKIVMIDKNVINVSPDSKLEIANYEFDPGHDRKDVLLNVIYGKVRSKVEQRYDGAKNKFEVKTPTAVAGVRGTDFLAGYQPSTQLSQVVTFEGEVRFGLPGPDGTISNAVSVRPGQFTEMAGSNPPPPPQTMPQSQLTNMDFESKAEGTRGESRQPSQDAPTNQEPEDSKDKGSPASGGDGKKSSPTQDGGDRSRRSSDASTSGGSEATGTEPSTNAPPGAPSTGSQGGEQARGPGGPEGESVNARALGGPNPSPEKRGPATVDGTAGMPRGGPSPNTMLRPEDMASSPSGVLPNFNSVMPPAPPNYLPPQPINCEFCSRLLERGNTLLRLNITKQ